jgi:hypothetical protein
VQSILGKHTIKVTGHLEALFESVTNYGKKSRVTQDRPDTHSFKRKDSLRRVQQGEIKHLDILPTYA